jgi:hypothetical protein
MEYSKCGQWGAMHNDAVAHYWINKSLEPYTICRNYLYEKTIPTAAGNGHRCKTCERLLAENAAEHQHATPTSESK